MSHSFHNQVEGYTKVNIAGQNMSSTYLNHLLEVLEGKDISVNVISKSGTTTEPAIAFRIFREYTEKKYGKEGARERINQKAFQGTLLAHVDGGVPNLIIEMDEMNEYTFGELEVILPP
ncbi:hypothetical protein AN963_22505 [Brevibacillus choshinensis]|uniref:Uncharacterized protein n=1 Tax=Brevibacillus choshinensis TaxID=54911 RepID=A0ABR5N139_BRECH|nr:hypothetical protein AN963_22505 [Brevibacillus choshinensis]